MKDIVCDESKFWIPREGNTVSLNIDVGLLDIILGTNLTIYFDLV